MRVSVGDRVIAVSSSKVKEDKKTVFVFGRGVYEGDHDCKVMGCFGNGEYLKNPRIKLDNGNIV